MRRVVVLDKKFLDGEGRDSIRKLCADYAVLMLDTLFFELITTTDIKFQAACFRKFPEGENPVEVIEGVPELLRHEIESVSPASPVYERRMPIRFKFNEKLSTGTFNWSAEQQKDVSDWGEQMMEDAVHLTESYAITHAIFPTIAEYKGGQSAEEIDRIQTLIGTDTEMIRSFYDQIRHDTFPQAKLLTPDWAFYRLCQVRLLFAVEFIRRYGAGKRDVRSKEIPQDAADSHYLVLAALAGGFATKEKWLQRAFKLLRSDGLLIS